MDIYEGAHWTEMDGGVRKPPVRTLQRRGAAARLAGPALDRTSMTRGAELHDPLDGQNSRDPPRIR
jgi:hypothetical protein